MRVRWSVMFAAACAATLPLAGCALLIAIPDDYQPADDASASLDQEAEGAADAGDAQRDASGDEPPVSIDAAPPRRPFGDGGVVTFPLDDTPDFVPTAVTIAPDTADILIAGNTASVTAGRVLRVSSSGTLDVSFTRNAHVADATFAGVAAPSATSIMAAATQFSSRGVFAFDVNGTSGALQPTGGESIAGVAAEPHGQVLVASLNSTTTPAVAFNVVGQGATQATGCMGMVPSRVRYFPGDGFLVAGEVSGKNAALCRFPGTGAASIATIAGASALDIAFDGQRYLVLVQAPSSEILQVVSVAPGALKPGPAVVAAAGSAGSAPDQAALQIAADTHGDIALISADTGGALVLRRYHGDGNDAGAPPFPSTFTLGGVAYDAISDRIIAVAVDARSSPHTLVVYDVFPL